MTKRSITSEEIKKIATISKLSALDDEMDRFSNQFTRIFDYFFQMSLVEDHTESTSSGLGINNHMLAKLIALPLTDREEQVLVQYLVQRYRTDVRELIYMTLLIHYYYYQ